jgi:ATP-dependent DNA helicase RecG
MIADRLAEIIARGETYNVEFKGEEKHPLSDHDLVDAVVCLANGDGGLLVIGVEDDGRITGARPRQRSKSDPLSIQATIANRTRPSLSCKVELGLLEGKEVLVIEIPKGITPVGTADGKYIRRAILGRGEPGCVPFHFHEMQSQQAARGWQDYSALIVPEAKWDDLDPLEFERFRRIIRDGHGDSVLLPLSDLELAKSLGAVEANHEIKAIRVLGLLLFGRESTIHRFLPTHEAAIQFLSNTQVEANDFFRWPMLRLMDEVLGRFRARNREDELMIGLVRVGIPDYSERAFRETVVNALVHRDYSRYGAVHIQWYPDRIEVSNPGGFPERT